MIGLAIEALLVAAIAAATLAFGVPAAVGHALEQAAGIASPACRDAAEVLTLARRSGLPWAGGLLALLAGRWLGLARRPGSIGAPLLVPAVAACTALGLLLHWGYADPLHDEILYAPGYAAGVLLAGVLGGLILGVRARPRFPERWAPLGRHALLAGALLLLAALIAFGEGPTGASDARINLLGGQPIELVKLAFVAWLALVLGRRAPQLRTQRVGRRWLQVPRPRYLLPAFAVLAGLFLLLFLVGDLGPTLVLGLCFLAFYGVVTLSWVELALAAIGAAGLYVLALADPLGLVPEHVATRIAMVRDPWINGLANGDQLARGLWAFAAGGFFGQGFGLGAFRAIPAGHTDLALASLAEAGGVAGSLVYLGALLLLALQGLWIAHCNRTCQRQLLAFGLTALLLAQWFVIFAGTIGRLPLTGIVVPFLSHGRSGMVAFVLAVALLGRLAVGGRPAAPDLPDLAGLRRGFGWAAAGVVLLGLWAGAELVRVGVLRGDRHTGRPVVTLQADGTAALRHDPRILAVERRIRRGTLFDRQGEVLAESAADGGRSYPLGADLGTLLGPVSPVVEAPSWSLERALDGRLRGLAGPGGRVSVWGRLRGGQGARRFERLLLVLPGEACGEPEEARARALAGPGAAVWCVGLPVQDLGRLVPLVHLRRPAREDALAALEAAIGERSVRLTLDARLQTAAAAALRERVARRGEAGAAVVLDVDTGEVLARAQWPDYDPGRPADWLPAVLAADPTFVGSYGPWPDKTGVKGLYQAGSIFKLFTALAWARGAGGWSGEGCAARSEGTFTCALTPGDPRPAFEAPGWTKPIHDSHKQPDGQPDLARALGVSCNVFFAQLGLALGPEALAALAADGLEVDDGDLVPGGAGSRTLGETAFGQGAARVHVSQAARLVATVASGGVYRRCPTTLVLGEPCEERRLVPEAARLTPVLAGMDQAVRGERGTARAFKAPAGVRVYAKTGTADDPGRRDEAPWGYARGREGYPPHSWFVAIAEPAGNPACRPGAPGRLAVAVVIPRGGYGSDAALPVAQEIVQAAADLGYFDPR